METLNITALSERHIKKRLELCWGKEEEWKNLEVIEGCRRWLKKVNNRLKTSTFLAYENGKAIGMVEFIPYKMLTELGLPPCRTDVDANEVPERYLLDNNYSQYLFISCLWVDKEHQGRGVGGGLLNHLQSSEILEEYNGLLVYTRKKDDSWDNHISWPTGPKEFYQKYGFNIIKKLENPAGYILEYQK